VASTSSRTAVVLALVGNGFLTVLKLVGFAVSGSGAMLSEGLHSAADTANQALLYVGIRRSERPANALFPYGFGGERFLFALFSAVGIFVLGCGVTLYHGVHAALHPADLHLDGLVFAVLGISLVVDGWVLKKALDAIRPHRGDRGLVEYLRTSSDPTAAAVVLEDGAACLGVLVALVGILLSWLTGSHVPDVVATFVIGAMMGLIAVFLGYKNSTLIVGQAIPRRVQRDVLDFLEAQPTVEAVRSVQSRILGAEHFRLKAEIDWDGRVLGERLAGWVAEHADGLAGGEEARREFARRFGERLTDALSAEVDRIEAELMRRHPELAYVDLESDDVGGA